MTNLIDTIVSDTGSSEMQFNPLVMLSIGLLFACIACMKNGSVNLEISSLDSSPSANTKIDISKPTPISTATPLPRSTPASPDENPSETESVNHYIQAHRMLNRGDFKEAEQQFDMIIDLEPHFAHAWSGLGQSLLLQGEYEDSLYYFDKAIELRPIMAGTYALRGLSRVALLDFDGALRDADNALRLNPDIADAYIVLGRAHGSTRQSELALKAFNTAVKKAPDDAGTYWWRGRFFRDNIGDFDKALSDFDKAAELEPAVAVIYLERAILRFEAGIDLTKIRDDLEEAISLSKDPPLPVIQKRGQDLLEKVKEIELQMKTQKKET